MMKSRWILAGGLLAVVAAGVAVGAAFRSDMALARAQIEDRSRVISSPFGDIEYAEAGAGPVLLLIHGSGGGFDQGLAFGRPLLDLSVRTIAPSRFGYLDSAMPDGATPQMQADALAHLLAQLGEEQVVIFGGSAGALSATQLALRHPGLCRGLVLVVPAIYSPDRAPNTNAAPNPLVNAMIGLVLGSDFLFWAGVKAAPDFMTEMVLATEPALLENVSDAERRRVREVLFHILPVSRRKAGILMDSRDAGDPPPYPLEQITCPALVISAQDDLYGTAASAAHAAAQIPNSRLVLYPTGGHLWVGHDEALWATVAEFVRSLEPAQSPPAG